MTESCTTSSLGQVSPNAVLTIELGERIPDLNPVDNDCLLRFATVLITLHGMPIALLRIDANEDGVSAKDVAAIIWRETREQIERHLLDDDLQPPAILTPSGLGSPITLPPCGVRRRSALDKAPHFTIIIATRDRTASLLRCLHSIAGLNYPNFDVVIIDSCPSGDDTEIAVGLLGTHIGRARLRYVREARAGLAIAHNRGIQVAAGSWIAITDDDVLVDREWLAALAESVVVDPKVACVTGLILPAELDTHAQVLLEQYGGFARGFTPRSFDLQCNRPADPMFPLTAGRLGSGANMAFKTTILRSIGGFDPAIGAGTPAKGGDDLAAFVAVVQAGHTVSYQPCAVIWHYHRRDYAALRRQAFHYGVGLGAYLMSAIAHDPRLIRTATRNIRRGLVHLIEKDSPKNQGKASDFPRELEFAERVGVLLGPLAYVWSRWLHRRQVHV